MIWTRFLVPFESNLTPNDSYVSAQLACLEMIKSGTTAFADSGGVHMDRVADAVIESGMRASIAKSTMDMGAAITGAMKETAEEAIKNTEELYKAYQGSGDGRIDIWFAIRQVMTCSEKLMRMVSEKAKEYNTGIHAHLCEHKDEVSFCLQNYKKRPAELLNDMGVLGPNLLTAHNVVLSEHDITLIAEKGVKVIHCPRANLANHGFPKTPRILEAGISVGLGCDGAAPSNLDLFDEMKVLRYGTIAYWGLTVFDPVVLRCSTLLKMATQGGANAIQHGDILGSVEVGKKADLILLNINQPHIAPSQNLVNSIVDAAGGHDITDSIINGKIVMKNREVLTLDEEKIIAESKVRMKEIISRAGY
jgi:5-methylthioadenosine/S-adenosylhomocysteine deaminase